MLIGQEDLDLPVFDTTRRQLLVAGTLEFRGRRA
jgi:hypothetical protein